MTEGVARLNDRIDHGGEIISASENTKVNRRKVARLNDLVLCSIHGLQRIITASTTVKCNGRGVARRLDRISCGARISTASENVKAGD